MIYPNLRNCTSILGLGYVGLPLALEFENENVIIRELTCIEK